MLTLSGGNVHFCLSIFCTGHEDLENEGKNTLEQSKFLTQVNE